MYVQQEKEMERKMMSLEHLSVTEQNVKLTGLASSIV
jgi:hypothetical protein